MLFRSVAAGEPVEADDRELNVNLEDIIEKEVDPGLGNGGLGRLAACFMDSIATLGLPGMGYGIHYEYGMFRQKIEDGQQVERPDAWLEKGASWEFIRPSKRFTVHFGGSIHFEGKTCIWDKGERVVALAYDQVIPGYKNDSASTLRLWSAHAGELFNLEDFNRGQHVAAMELRASTKNISRVLYLMIPLGMAVNCVYAKNISLFPHHCKISSIAINVLILPWIT